MGMGNPHGFRFSLVHLHKTLRMSNSCYSSLMEVRRGHSKPLGLVDGGQVQRVKGDHGTHCNLQATTKTAAARPLCSNKHSFARTSTGFNKHFASFLAIAYALLSCYFYAYFSLCVH